MEVFAVELRDFENDYLDTLKHGQLVLRRPTEHEGCEPGIWLCAYDAENRQFQKLTRFEDESAARDYYLAAPERPISFVPLS